MDGNFRLCRACILNLLFLLPLFCQQEPRIDSQEPLSGSSLAPERPINKNFALSVDEILADIEKRTPAAGTFSVKIEVAAVKGFQVDFNRDKTGLNSYKTTLNWNPPPEGENYHKNVSLLLTGNSDSFRLERLDSKGTTAEWWHKEGGYLYSSQLLASLPFITRWRACEALESNMLAYGEGAGLRRCQPVTIFRTTNQN